MFRYSLYAICDECSDTHRLNGSVEFFGGPAEITSLHVLFDGEPLPRQIKAIVAKSTFCKKTKRLTIQKNSKRIFLVPE